MTDTRRLITLFSTGRVDIDSCGRIGSKVIDRPQAGKFDWTFVFLDVNIIINIKVQ